MSEILSTPIILFSYVGIWEKEKGGREKRKEGPFYYSYFHIPTKGYKE